MPENMAPPPLPKAVSVPAGHRHAMTFKAIGTLNYECRTVAGMSGAYGWVLDAPDAELRHWSGFRAGRYYAGPTWEYRDGSRITGRLVATSPGHGLPTQLYEAKATARAGEFSEVTYIQRLNAVGGEPGRTCNAAAVGHGAKVDFTADFMFYKKAK